MHIIINEDKLKLLENSIGEDVDPSSVDLSSFKLNSRLHPKFWKDDRLDSRVRLKLLDIADDFIDFMGITWVDYDDILMTGSLANFNWSEKYSDIDLHIVMDYGKIDKRKDFVNQFLKAQTMLWNKEHEDIDIKGFPVEIYVQDKGEELNAGGVYSLDKNKWIKEPKKDDLSDACINRRWVQRKVASYMDSIDNLEERLERAKKDEYKLEQVDIAAEKLFNKIKDERAQGFKKGGDEMNDQNIVFKTLRREGYIGKLSDMRKKLYNTLNSL